MVTADARRSPVRHRPLVAPHRVAGVSPARHAGILPASGDHDLCLRSPGTLPLELLREHFLSRAPNGYKLAYSILELSQQKIKLLEQEFLEILSSYAFDEVQEEHRCGRRSDPIHPELYELFTYSLDPKINTDNKVTFLIPS